MSKGNISNHYVPRLILRKFGDRLCLYNVKTGKLHENIASEHAYAIDGLYEAEIERKLNKKLNPSSGICYQLCFRKLIMRLI